MGVPRLGASLAVLVLLAGCAGPGGPREDSRSGWDEATIPPGWTLDLEYVWSSGQPATWAWATDGGQGVYFQLLSITGGSSYALVAQHGNASSGERTAPQSGRYDYVWQNEGRGNVTLLYSVPDGHLHRLWPPGEGPACPPPLLGRPAC